MVDIITLTRLFGSDSHCHRVPEIPDEFDPQMLEPTSTRSLGDIPASTLVYHGLCAGCNLGLGSPSGFATLRGAFASDYVFALAGRSVLGLQAFTLFALHSVLALVFVFARLATD